MSLLTLFVTLVIVGIVMYLVNTYIPMESRIKNILNIAVVVVVVIWVLKVLGVLAYLGNIHL